MKEKLELTEKDKAVASRAARIAGAGHHDDFWAGVQKEVDRLEAKAPQIKPRDLGVAKRLL